MPRSAFAAFTYVAIVVISTGHVCFAANRPQYSHQAELTPEGVIVAARNIAIGRFTGFKENSGVKMGTFQCGEVLKGKGWLDGESYVLNTQTMIWQRLSDSKDIVVYFPHVPTSIGGTKIGTHKEAVEKVKSVCALLEKAPVGQRVGAIGLHLRPVFPGADQSGNHCFLATVVNYSTIPYTVNVDKRVSANPTSHNRSVWIRVMKAPEADADPAQRPTIVYASQRPWVGQGVVSTARANSRPDRPVQGATVRLESLSRATVPVELRPTGRPNEFVVYINGHRDLGGEVVLEPALYRVSVGLDDDYHYYTRNGAKIGARDYWFGQALSGEVQLDLRPKQKRREEDERMPSDHNKTDADDGK